MNAFASVIPWPTAAGDGLAAQADAAGRAFGCAFSSSDEYVAALISARRARDNYGLPTRRQQLLRGSLFAVMAALIFIAI
jgi:hypothetical protein